jgi:predicted NAD/FAD-binding protein
MKSSCTFDERFMPTRKLAWAAWNYHINQDSALPVSLTYNMNILQNLKINCTNFLGYA